MNKAFGLCLLACGALVSACSSKSEALPTMLSQTALEDPSECRRCHTEHYREWSGSMHAYAADDPIFLALNEKGQAETKGPLGNFCVQCHAPTAVRRGLTTDGLNLKTLPANVKGIGCYDCHAVTSIKTLHNNKVVWGDGTLFGAIADPSSKAPHSARASNLHDRSSLESSKLCGTCHDVLTTKTAHVARTFEEWSESIYSKPDPKAQLSCGNCHMPARTRRIVDDDSLPLRSHHDHSMPGVDVALTPFPEREAQKKLVQEALDRTLTAKLCVKPFLGGVQVEVTLDNAFAGHSFPSGSAYHRRAWVEIRASRGGKEVYAKGVVDDKTALSTARAADPSIFALLDQLLGDDKKPVSHLWEAAGSSPLLLTPSVTNDRKDPRFYHAMAKTFDIPGPVVDSVAVVAKIRPIDRDVTAPLVAEGLLDASVAAAVPTYALGSTRLTWNLDQGFVCVP